LANKRIHLLSHFRDESFQSITCTGSDNITRTTQETESQKEHKIMQHNQSGPREHYNQKKIAYDRQGLV